MRTTLFATLLMAASITATYAGSNDPVAPVPAPSSARAVVSGSLADVIPDVAERTVQSVVSITIRQKVRTLQFDADSGMPIDEEGFSPQLKGVGSGVIINSTGRIVTNAHVVQQADAIKVALSDGREFDATLVGADARTDVAVLQLKGNVPKLVPLPFGDSASIRLGEVVLAIGNPFGVGQSVSMGIISAKNRQIGIEGIEDFIQTDAAINPGNSGGALVNLRGELVGINTAKGPDGGVGFAIPNYIVAPVIEALVKDGKVTRAYLGVEPMTMDKDIAEKYGFDSNKGVILRSVVGGGPADVAGLKQSDIVLAIDGTEIKTSYDLRRIIGSGKVGTKVKLDVLRNGKGAPLTLTATLQAFPEPNQQPKVKTPPVKPPTPRRKL
jgi:S1-C subfamily serine protease